MSPKQAEVVQATANAEAARQRLTGTTAALQQRLKPETLVRDMRQGLKEAGVQAGGTAKRYPAPIAGAVAVAGLFLARHRIAGLFRRSRATAGGTASYSSDES